MADIESYLKIVTRAIISDFFVNNDVARNKKVQVELSEVVGCKPEIEQVYTIFESPKEPIDEALFALTCYVRDALPNKTQAQECAQYGSDLIRLAAKNCPPYLEKYVGSLLESIVEHTLPTDPIIDVSFDDPSEQYPVRTIDDELSGAPQSAVTPTDFTPPSRRYFTSPQLLELAGIPGGRRRTLLNYLRDVTPKLQQRMGGSPVQIVHGKPTVIPIDGPDDEIWVAFFKRIKAPNPVQDCRKLYNRASSNQQP